MLEVEAPWVVTIEIYDFLELEKDKTIDGNQHLLHISWELCEILNPLTNRKNGVVTSKIFACISSVIN